MRFAFAATIALTIQALSLLPAHARPDTRNMTCDQAIALLKVNKAMVLATGPMTYDRFVAGPGSCAPGHNAVQASAPTIDAQICKLGFLCQETQSN